MSEEDRRGDRDRIAALEEANAHLTREVEALSDEVAGQWKRIEELTLSLLRLRDRVSTVEDGAGGPHPVTRPPHY